MRLPWQHENLDACFGLIQSLSLLRRGFSSNFLQHLTLQELSILLGDDLQGLVPFAGLRDPWTRFLSSFRRKDPDLCSLYRYKCHADLHAVGLEEYVDLASWLDHPHLRPQWKFVSTSSGNDLDPRVMIFRQEQMSDLESWLSRRLGRVTRLPTSNVQVSVDSVPDIDSQQLQRIRKRVNVLYAKDLELLNRCCPPGIPESPDL